MTEPEDRFDNQGKIMPRPPLFIVPKEVRRMSHVACPWCGWVMPAEPSSYIEHVRDCREDKAG
jgi:hypothetical protein